MRDGINFRWANLLKITVLSLVIVLFNTKLVKAADGGGEAFDPAELINHHIMDSHTWHFWDGHYGTLYLPVILYSSDRGIEVFSSSRFYDEGHNLVEFDGYTLDHEHIVPVEEGRSVLDFSITKNVAFLFLNSAIMLLVFFAVAKGYKKRPNQAPKGIQSLFEPIIVFVRDDIVKPNIGPRYEKYLPYMLTLFFFIWFGNLLGLMPGAANLTGNIAVTLVLAVLTFLITNFSGNRAYWKHIFNTPGVPWWLKFPIPMMPFVEVIGMFTKPFALLIRLFVAITAGHIVILSLISLVFIFQSYAVGFGATVIVVFISFIELLVATIQAYVFTMFSSLYIGLAIAEHHAEHH